MKEPHVPEAIFSEQYKIFLASMDSKVYTRFERELYWNLS
jgi:hypothetical protein